MIWVVKDYKNGIQLLPPIITRARVFENVSGIVTKCYLKICKLRIETQKFFLLKSEQTFRFNALETGASIT